MHIQVIGKDSYGLNDFMLQWALFISAQFKTTLELSDVDSFEVFGNRLDAEIHVSKLRIFKGNLQIPSEDESNRQFYENDESRGIFISSLSRNPADISGLPADLSVLFVEQHLSSFLHIKKALLSRSIQPSLIVFWNFQVGRYSENYWRKSLLSEFPELRQVPESVFLLKEKDAQCWISQQLKGDLTLSKLSKSHIHQLFTTWKCLKTNGFEGVR